jgi:hypothetical protein
MGRLLELDVPEYFVTHIGRAERIPGNCVRFWMCMQRGDILEPRYTCIWPVECLLSRHELIALVGKDAIRELTSH